MDIKFALSNWIALNDALRACNEEQAEALLKAELKGEARGRYISRIYTRFSRTRSLRERKELAAKVRR